MGYSHRSIYYLARCAHSHFAKCGIDNRWGGRMRANGAWDKALKPEKFGILSNAETKLDVVNAMADLMEITPLEKLTVSQICKASGISRSSFYRCFEDKYAVAQWHIQFVHLNGVDQIGERSLGMKATSAPKPTLLSTNDFMQGPQRSPTITLSTSRFLGVARKRLSKPSAITMAKSSPRSFSLKLRPLQRWSLKRCLGGTTTPSTRSRLSRNANGCANSSLVISSTCSTSLSSDK